MFLELRAKGWSLSHIAERLNVSQRTLVDWNRQEHEQIRTLRAIECEALQEKILATHEQELIRLKKELDRLSALVWSEIRKVCQVQLPLEGEMAPEE